MVFADAPPWVRQWFGTSNSGARRIGARLVGALAVSLLATTGSARTITYQFDLRLQTITHDRIHRAIDPDDLRYGYDPTPINNYDATGSRRGEINSGQRLRATFDDISGALTMLERCFGGFSNCRDESRSAYVSGEVDYFQVYSAFGCCVSRYNFTDGPWDVFSPNGMSYRYITDDSEAGGDATGPFFYFGRNFEWDIINLTRLDDGAPPEEPPHMPLPGALPLMAAGIIGLGLLRRRTGRQTG